MKRIRILLVDDHPIVREGIRSSLTADEQIEIVGEAEDGNQAIIKALQLQPDIVLLDISMPRMDGLEAAKHLRELVPATKVLVLTMHDDKEYLLEVGRFGAKGYVLKDTSPAELIQAIRAVHDGETFVGSRSARVLMKNLVQQAGQMEKPLPKDLTRREQQVLAMIAEGLSSRVMASRLAISVRTVETHREHLMNKLDIHTTAGLTQYAIKKGIIKLK